jgi:hypothetical protein
VSAATTPTARLRRIEVSVHVGTDRMAASDDPLFLELQGPGGREFRLAMAHGKALRRGAADHFVLAGAADPSTNVAFPELNDPAVPPIPLEGVTCVVLRKGQEPIPNVRGHGEMDDRLQVLSVEVVLVPEGDGAPRRFRREGPFWLGLVCGERAAIPPDESRA